VAWVRISKVADLTPDAPSMPAFALGAPWTIAVGVRQKPLLDWLLGQDRPVLFIEPNQSFADRLRQDGLEKRKGSLELVDVALGSETTEIQWYSYNDCRFDGPTPLEVFRPNYPNLMLQSSVQRPQARLDDVALDWLKSQQLSQEMACGLLVIEAAQALPLLQGANSLFPWLASIVLRPSHLHTPRQGPQNLEQEQALHGLLAAAHFGPEPGLDGSQGFKAWRIQPQGAAHVGLQEGQALLSESHGELHTLKVQRDELLRQLEEMHVHNGRLAEYRDLLETDRLTLSTQLQESQACLQDLQSSHDQLQSENQELRRRQQELIVLVESSCQDLAQLSDRLLAMPERLGPTA